MLQEQREKKRVWREEEDNGKGTFRGVVVVMIRDDGDGTDRQLRRGVRRYG